MNTRKTRENMNKHYEIIKTFDTFEEFLKYSQKNMADDTFDMDMALYTFVKHLESKIAHYRAIIENMGHKRDIDW